MIAEAIILIRIANRELNVKLNGWEYPEDTDTCSTNLSYQVLFSFLRWCAISIDIQHTIFTQILFHGKKIKCISYRFEFVIDLSFVYLTVFLYSTQVNFISILSHNGYADICQDIDRQNNHIGRRTKWHNPKRQSQDSRQRRELRYFLIAFDK